MSGVEWFVDMARNNMWANERLYGACEKLLPSELVAPRTGFFPSILGTLVHLAAVDAFYLDGLEGGGVGPDAFDRVAQISAMPALRSAQRDLDARLHAYCAKLTDAALVAPVGLSRRDGVHVDRAGDILLHLFMHQVHHRGQVHAMLSGTRIAPPQLDEFFLADERPIAERELAAMGRVERR